MPWQLGQFFACVSKQNAREEANFWLRVRSRVDHVNRSNRTLSSVKTINSNGDSAGVQLLSSHHSSTLSQHFLSLEPTSLSICISFIALFFFFCFINSHLSSVSDLKAMPFCGSSYAHCPHLTHKRSSQVRF